MRDNAFPHKDVFEDAIIIQEIAACLGFIRRDTSAEEVAVYDLAKSCIGCFLQSYLCTNEFVEASEADATVTRVVERVVVAHVKK